MGNWDQWCDCFGWACRPAMASMYSGVMEGGGEEVAAWLTSPAFESRLFTSFPCTNIIPSAANQVLLPLLPVPSCLVFTGASLPHFVLCASPLSPELPTRYCFLFFLFLLVLFSLVLLFHTLCYVHQHCLLSCQPGNALLNFLLFLV